jgi:N-acylglucosamine 2-epimerase
MEPKELSNGPASTTAALAPFIDRYRDDLDNSVVPFWLRHSLDREYGGYFSCLDQHGAVYDDRKYVWLQGRAVWTFSKLYNDYDRDPSYLEAARLGYDFLRRFAVDARGQTYFSLTRDGSGFSYQRKPFGIAFHTIALIEYAKAAGDESLIRVAEDMFSKVLRYIAQPSMLGRPACPGQIPSTSLPEQLVAVTIALQLARLRPGGSYDELVRSITETVEQHYSEEHSVFLDNAFIEGYSVEWPECRLLNPGHAIEMSWQLMEAATLLGDSRVEALALAALEGSLRLGWDSEYGGLYYFVDVAGAPTLLIEAAMKLWWTHAEAIVALVMAYARTGSAQWLQWLRDIDQYTYSHFVDREGGELFGYLDRTGGIVNKCKGGNYKGFYHVPRALLLSILCYEQLLMSNSSIKLGGSWSRARR